MDRRRERERERKREKERDEAILLFGMWDKEIWWVGMKACVCVFTILQCRSDNSHSPMSFHWSSFIILPRDSFVHCVITKTLAPLRLFSSTMKIPMLLLVMFVIPFSKLHSSIPVTPNMYVLSSYLVFYSPPRRRNEGMGEMLKSWKICGLRSLS